MQTGCEGSLARQAEVWEHCLCHGWYFRQADPSPRGQEGDSGPAEASGCCGQPQLHLFCPLLKEGSRAQVRGAVCRPWRVGKGPNYLTLMMVLALRLLRALSSSWYITVIPHRRSRYRGRYTSSWHTGSHSTSPTGVPRAVTGRRGDQQGVPWDTAPWAPCASAGRASETAPSEDRLTLLRTSCSLRYRLVTISPLRIFMNIFSMSLPSWRMVWDRHGGEDTK